MKFGVSMFPTDYAIPPVELGRALEERGFESVFFPEHSHTPVSRESPYPAGGELPDEYNRTHDPFIALAAIAATTERLKLGTGITLVIQRDPIYLAKEISSLDLLSGGRVLFGVGGGWNREEMRDHGIDPRTRWSLMRERIEAMKTIWANDVAEYHGEYVDFAPMWQWPKPVQRPHPPILLGNNTRNAIDRVVAYADEWMPIGSRVPLDELIPEMNEKAAAVGRGPIPVTVSGVSGNEEAITALLEVGAHRVILRVPPAGAERVMPLLDQYARLQEQFA